MSNILLSFWGFVKVLWQEIVSVFDGIIWEAFLKGALMGTLFTVFLAIPWMFGLEVVAKKLMERAGYTQANLQSFTPTVVNWWMADNAPVIILVMGYIIFAMGMYIWVRPRK